MLVLSYAIPLYSTASKMHLAVKKICRGSYLTLRLFKLKFPQPNIGGILTMVEYIQIKMRVKKAERGLDSGKFLFLVTIMQRCMARMDKVTTDWIPTSYAIIIF